MTALPHRPELLHTLFDRHHEQRDLAALLALFEPGALLDVGGRERRGTAEIRAGLEEFLALDLTLTSTTRSVHVLGDVALTAADWTAAPRADPGAATTGVSVEIARCQPDGRWLYAVDVPGFVT